MTFSRPVPAPNAASVRLTLQAYIQKRHILGALEALHESLGDVFRLPFPGFDSVMVVGPEANKFMLTESRESFLWRAEDDPVTRLLRQGLLVTDGAFHDELRQLIAPALHRSLFDHFVTLMWQHTDRISEQWRDGGRIYLLDEMRRIALCVLTDALFPDNFGEQVNVLWRDVLRVIRYISPGLWLLWPGIPRPGYRRARQRMDDYLYQLIARRHVEATAAPDLLSNLIDSGMSDELIRDQLLTMFIAGHDTSTALLAWTLYLLLTHEDAMAHVRSEIETIVGNEAPSMAHVRRLGYLDRVIKEALRLYPPIHLGSRITATDLVLQGFHIPAGTRVLYSIYLTHRDKNYWSSPEVFDPDRFLPDNASRRSAYAFLPFGAGPRNCIGAAFAQVEAKIILARLLQRFDFLYVGGKVRPRMQATLEPYPGVLVESWRRPNGGASDH